MTTDESLSLSELTSTSNRTLLYRATRDGFTAKAFHEKCDGKANTVTIIKTDGNYVFGGYTSAKWNSDGKYVNDPNAFIFSLRRNGISISQKFMVTQPQFAIAGHPGYGPRFGIDDINIGDRSNIIKSSWASLCVSYQCPLGYTRGDYKNTFLAGSYNNFLVTEIEVYQITKNSE